MPSMLLCALLCAPLLAATAGGPATTPAAVVRAMHDRYAKSWYKTLTFSQKTTEHHPDGTTKVSTWYEAASIPGKLRIDFDPVADGNGILFADDHIYQFEGGKQTRSDAMVHPLMVLGFDVYALDPDATLAKIKGLGIDTSVMHEDTWQGRPVYVVGAKAGDTSSAQFWVDKENLYFVRLLQPSRDGKHATETQFNKYVRAGGGWVAAEVRFLADGQPRVEEEYTDIKADPKLDPELWNPAKWSDVHWR